jgi:transposase
VKINYSNTGLGRKDTTFFGGGIPVLREFEDRFHLPEITEKCLGKRVAQAKFSNYECLQGFMLSLNFNEGGCSMIRVEDTKENHKHFKQLKLGSHDTNGRFMKKFATPNKIHTKKNRKNPNEKPKAYVVNENEKMLRFNIETSLACGNLIPGVPYTFDIDLTVLRSKGKESSWTYKRHKGYTIMVGMIGNIIVYTHMRSGNANAHFMKLESIKKCIELLREYGIIIGRVRIDGAGYKNEVLDYLDSEGIKFIVNANASSRTHGMVLKSEQWKKKPFKTTSENWKDAELCSIPFNLTNSKKIYRLVTIRTKYKMRKVDEEEINEDERKYSYKYTITNDNEIGEYDLLKEYHARGNAEKNFANLKDQFGWRILPFSKLNENHVYLLMTAICHNLFQAILKIYNKLSKGFVEKNIELKTFRLMFLNVRCKITRKGKFEFSNFKVELEAILLRGTSDG